VRAQATKRSCSSCPSMTTPVAEGEEKEEEEKKKRQSTELISSSSRRCKSRTVTSGRVEEWKRVSPNIPRASGGERSLQTNTFQYLQYALYMNHQWSTVTIETNIAVPVTASYSLHSTPQTYPWQCQEPKAHMKGKERKGKQFPDPETQ
jgi:hypothetical protein